MTTVATRTDLLALFDGNISEAARQLNINRSALYKTPEELTDNMRRRVVFWHITNGRKVPRKWLATDKAGH